MKRILFYIDSLRVGGAQRVMSNLICYFAECGYEVLLVNDYIDLSSDIFSYSVPSSVKRLYLRNNLEGNKYIKNIERIIRLRNIVKTHNPDVMLSFLEKPNKRLILSTLGLKNKKIVSVRNDPFKEYGKSIIRKAIANIMYSFADGIVFQTEEAQDFFINKIKRKSKIIMNPVSNLFFERTWLGLDKSIITCGRLVKQKNHRLLINAFAQIADQFSDYKLIIYGEGPLRDELQKISNELGLHDRIILAGNCEGIPEILQKAELFVLTSDYEGLPNALMEALAVGVPCISTDCPCGGPKMLIQSGINGLLTKCGDEKMLAEKMRFILSNKEQAKQLGDSARELSKKYSPRIIYKTWEEYIFK